MPAILGPAQWAAYVDLATPPPPGLEFYRDIESVDFAAASARMTEAARAERLRPMPLIVISRAKPVQLPPNVPPAFSADAFEAAWRKGQSRLAALLPDARREIAAENDHYVQVEQSELAVEAIRALVEAVRDPSAWRMCRRAQIDALTCVQESDVFRFVQYSRWQSSWYILGWYSNEFMRDIEWRNSLAKYGDGRICRSLPGRSSIKRR